MDGITNGPGCEGRRGLELIGDDRSSRDLGGSIAAGCPTVGIGFQPLSIAVPLAGVHAPAGATMVPLDKVAGEMLEPIVPGT